MNLKMKSLSKLGLLNESFTIIFCRHLASKSCRKELLSLWYRLSVQERQKQRLILIYGDGDESSIKFWKEDLSDTITFIKDENFEVFSSFELYSGLVVMAKEGLILKKYPLSLLENLPPAPYRFLKNHELKQLSKI